MMGIIRNRRGNYLYFAVSCSFVLAYLTTSFTKRGWPKLPNTFQVYPWQMVAYDESNCGCPRYGPPILRESDQSLCSDWSTSRGLGQKVVSYSLYGNRNNTQVNKKYYMSVEDRLKEVDKFYKGFIVRLYHNLSSSDRESREFLCHMYCTYPFFDPCQVENLYHQVPKTNPDLRRSHSSKINLPKFQMHNSKIKKDRMRSSLIDRLGPIDSNAELANEGPKSYQVLLVGKMWRFLVMGDPLVSEFLVRDVDSSILEREVAAVEQWLYNSTALLHVMRDHPSHNGVMLAGLWGGSRARAGHRLSGLLWEMLKWPPRNIWDYDQVLLRRVVWPEVTNDVLVHDSYFCGNRRFQSKHRSEPFPTRRDGRYFVGWGPLRDAELDGISICPRQCRPVNHQDWILC
ncbi:uncharacterized protein LOC135210304 [Macrobrachium nipponense]|uniref:uncharacterized protein LOC135210304 n=1 Tax=Macrobrachium nipponense TaxID=159736 RepID=UPI0030C84D04